MSFKRVISLVMSIVIAVTAFMPSFAYGKTKPDVAFGRPEILTLGTSICFRAVYPRLY